MASKITENDSSNNADIIAFHKRMAAIHAEQQAIKDILNIIREEEEK